MDADKPSETLSEWLTMRQGPSRYRFSGVVILWVGFFALLLLLLTYLPRERLPVSGSTSAFLDKPRTPVTFTYGSGCNLLVNSGGWIHLPYVRCEESTVSVATCGPNHTDNWQFSSEARHCGAGRQGTAEARLLFKQKWVVMAGDSITRFLFAALLRLLADDDDQRIVFGHQDFEYSLPGNVKASFVWAPYAANLTGHLQQWTTAHKQPDFVVVSTGLWHMLHIADPDGYSEALGVLKQMSNSFMNAQASNPIFMHFLSISEVYPPKLKPEEKRERLTLQSVDKYNQQIQSSHMLQPDGPFDLIDMHHLTQGCGPECTHDGLHYSNATYDAALQIWMNSLLVD